MVIHDMRNPTNSIEFAIKEVLRVLTTAAMTYDGSQFDKDSEDGGGPTKRKRDTQNFMLQ